MSKRLPRAIAAIAAIALASFSIGVARADISEVRISHGFGVLYLPLMVMDTLGLVQKHAGKLGMPSLKPEYKILGGTQSLIDALLSRQRQSRRCGFGRDHRGRCRRRGVYRGSQHNGGGSDKAKL